MLFLLQSVSLGEMIMKYLQFDNVVILNYIQNNKTTCILIFISSRSDSKHDNTRTSDHTGDPGGGNTGRHHRVG